MNETLEKIVSIMDLVVEEYFEKGKMNCGAAYANAMVARAYILSMTGDDFYKDVIEAVEDHPTCFPVLFPEAQAVENQLEDLELMHDMLQDSPGSRNVLMFVKNSQNLRFITPSQG